MIAIIDYGLGNPNSVLNMLTKIGVKACITNNFNELQNADKLILPGVGHFVKGMENLTNLGLIPYLNELVCVQKKPILGICLGMQLMANFSEEGNINGLQWIDANVLAFKQSKPEMKIPHMGWNSVILNTNSTLISPELLQTARFYFVHSYYVQLNNSNLEIGFTEYYSKFTSMFQKDNIFGVQFHPEKSHKFGMDLLTQFNKI